MSDDKKLIYKYKIPMDSVGNIFSIPIPWAFELLDIQLQGDYVVLWAKVIPNHAPQSISFYWLFTGDEDKRNYPYLRTVQIDGLVYHLFGGVCI